MVKIKMFNHGVLKTNLCKNQIEKKYVAINVKTDT